LTFALQTGEQLAVRWGDIDIHNEVVIFRRSRTRSG
jgi:hypothetical protein